MFDIEALYEAQSVSHAVSLLSEHPEAHIIAGGSDVLIKIREGKLAGCTLVSIQSLDELRGVVMEADGTLSIGSLTSFSHITRDPLIREHMGVLGEAVNQVGGPQIRNIGTIGGNTANGVTSADSASTLMAYDAIMEITGPDGKRETPITKFYINHGVVDLKHNEVLTAIRVREESYSDCKGYYIKYAMRNAMDIATLGCSVNVRLSGDKQRVERMRVGYGVAGPVPLRAFNAEAAANGKPVSMETVEAAARAALTDVKPRGSWRAGKELRLQLVEVLFKRAFIAAIERAGGGV